MPAAGRWDLNSAFKGLNILFCLITLKKAVLEIITITHPFKTKVDRNSKHSSTKKETQKANYKNVCSVAGTAAHKGTNINV
jgi:hypothetical protein